MNKLGRQFGLLWTGQSVSLVGDKVTLFVIPTLMIFVLGASAFQIGLISTAQYLAIPILSLVAGVVSDRLNLRLLLIACDLIRFAVILIIPIAYWQGFLSVWLIFGCVCLISATTVFFNIGYLPMLSHVVEKPQLVAGNSRMESSRTVAELGGPSLAAGLYALLGVASLVVDAFSYLFSAACLRTMQPVGVGQERRSVALLPRLWFGIKENWNDPVLRRCTAGTLCANLGGPIFVTQMPVLAYKGLGLGVGMFGLVMSVGAAGALAGALVAPKASRRFGPARTMAYAMVFHSLSGLGILATTSFAPAIVLAATLASYGFFFSWYNICSNAVRQARIPAKDQAVIYGAYRTVTWGVIPISTIVGGTVVTLLSRNHDILHAALIAMACATVIGTSAFLPLGGLQRLLDRIAKTPEPAMATS